MSYITITIVIKNVLLLLYGIVTQIYKGYYYVYYNYALLFFDFKHIIRDVQKA